MLKRLKNSWISIGIFFVCVFALYMTLMLEPYFTDEQDVFYGGYNVVMSGDVYANYLSQHMPFSYYMAAVPALLGARTVYQFRLGFYIMMSVLWTAVFARHRRALNNLGLVLIPFLYILQLQFYDYATTMISDHWQGIGLVMIGLEVIRYSREYRISTAMAGMVCLGIMLSFGTTFMSAYSLLMLFLGVAALQGIRLARHPEERKGAIREDLRLVGICLAPFVLLAGWYAATGNLENAFGGAYRVNVEVYSKYTGGLGTSPGGTFVHVFPLWAASWRTGLEYLREYPLYGIQLLLQNAALVIFAIRVGWKKPIAGITLFLAGIYAGIRGFDNFHGAAYMCVTAAALAGLAGEGIASFIEKRTVGRGVAAFAGMAAVIFLAAPSASTVKNLYHAPRYLRPVQVSAGSRDMLEILTDEGDRIHAGDVSFTSNMVMQYNLRLDDATMASSNPWFWEFWGEREMEILKENRTKVMLYSPNGELWGYRLRDYAPELAAYVAENYTMIESDLYVHNEALVEVRSRLEEAGYGLVGTNTSSSGEELMAMLYEGQTVEQHFPAAGSRMQAVWVRTATYMNSSQVGLKLTLLDAESGDVVAEAYRPKEELRDLRYTRFELKADMVPGRAYVLRMTADAMSTDEDTRLHLYRSAPDTDTEDTWAEVDDEPVNFNIVVQIEYAVNDQLQIV